MLAHELRNPLAPIRGAGSPFLWEQRSGLLLRHSTALMLRKPCVIAPIVTGLTLMCWLLRVVSRDRSENSQ